MLPRQPVRDRLLRDQRRLHGGAVLRPRQPEMRRLRLLGGASAGRLRGRAVLPDERKLPEDRVLLRCLVRAGQVLPRRRLRAVLRGQRRLPGGAVLRPRDAAVRSLRLHVERPVQGGDAGGLLHRRGVRAVLERPGRPGRRGRRDRGRMPRQRRLYGGPVLRCVRAMRRVPLHLQPGVRPRAGLLRPRMNGGDARRSEG